GSYLVRGVGPSLQAFGIGETLEDPRLGVVPGDGSALVGNDDWGTAPDVDGLRAAMDSAGAFPLLEQSKDAAVLIAAPAGVHTAIMRGAGDTVGVGLIDLYALPASGRSARLVNLSTRAR